jgi:hypothetical protein
MEELSQRRSQEGSAQKSRTWAVATPLWPAFSRPTPSGAGGRYRPSCSAGLLAPSLADSKDIQKENELAGIEEIKRWL